MFWFKDSLDDDDFKIIEEDINRYNLHIEQWLYDNWYTITKKDTRLCWYSYTVIKWIQLETKQTFTLNEMKRIIWITL